MVVKLSSWN